MNHYGAQAQTHWRTYLPESYAQTPDPETFFTEMGERAENQIAALQFQLAGDDIPGESFLDKVGRLNNAKMRAEEIVLPEEVLATPEKRTHYDPELDRDAEETDPREIQADEGWILLDPNKVIAEEEKEARRFVP